MFPTPKIHVEPALMNAACPWATHLEQLRDLFHCPYTGAMTVRTSMLKGYPDDPAVNQHRFFDVNRPIPQRDTQGLFAGATQNSYVFSPIPLATYLSYLQTISDELTAPSQKLVFVSVTGTVEEVAEAYRMVAQKSLEVKFPLCVEVNLSCPNVPNKQLPAYDPEELKAYLKALKAASHEDGIPRLPYGVKATPYTYYDQFVQFVNALAADGVSELSFITTMNTLGSCLLLDENFNTGLPQEGFGGVAGSPIHPLALGNVRILKTLLAANPNTKHLTIVGAGGVQDAASAKRMEKAGADIVAIASAIGFQGLEVFKRIAENR